MARKRSGDKAAAEMELCATYTAAIAFTGVAAEPREARHTQLWYGIVSTSGVYCLTNVNFRLEKKEHCND